MVQILRGSYSSTFSSNKSATYDASVFPPSAMCFIQSWIEIVMGGVVPFMTGQVSCSLEAFNDWLRHHPWMPTSVSLPYFAGRHLCNWGQASLHQFSFDWAQHNPLQQGSTHTQAVEISVTQRLHQGYYHMKESGNCHFKGGIFQFTNVHAHR